ncbi:hypothetical protein ALI22I_02650 [Saccharothrix sp. ALI-22-I]|uniref:amidohydrolase family protein n=1 Tax=Saccharothrix sp. ALI-22-I TaxID=1933778 RepID=UPI00097C0797|nr:amidohydrolase family protein [Saccharothrix sp. ALI-22-I]ONI92660.1 hypothetical protein ALI22I_02650 [Saccharothrix sp. ALI-22-I]
MKIIAMEEAFKIPQVDPLVRDHPFNEQLWDKMPQTKLLDVKDGRLADMDAAGIDVQVLSHTTPGFETMPAELAVRLAKQSNDILAECVAAHPDRFAGLASLPTPDPAAAADELERGVKELGLKGAIINGTTGNRFLDHESFRPVLERADALGTPIYLHPAPVPGEVADVYYGGFPDAVNTVLATAAWGWHVEVGLHALRLIISGVFDRYPNLRFIIGHDGEAVPFMLARASEAMAVVGLERSVEEYFAEHFFVTTSGFFAHAPFLCLLHAVGVDRILFAVDYPYDSNKRGRDFLDHLPVSLTDRHRIAHGNAERLLGIA